MQINVLEDLSLQCWRGWGGHSFLEGQLEGEVDSIWKLKIKFNIRDTLQYACLFIAENHRQLQNTEPYLSLI